MYPIFNFKESARLRVSYLTIAYYGTRKRHCQDTSDNLGTRNGQRIIEISQGELILAPLYLFNGWPAKLEAMAAGSEL